MCVCVCHSLSQSGPASTSLASRAWVNMMSNIFLESTPSVAVLVPPSSSMAAVLKALTQLPQKNDRIKAEVIDRRQSYTLRFGKCL